MNSITEAGILRKLHWNILQERQYVEMRFFSECKFKFSVIDYNKKFME